MKGQRELGQLVSIGPAMLRDFELLDSDDGTACSQKSDADVSTALRNHR